MWRCSWTRNWLPFRGYTLGNGQVKVHLAQKLLVNILSVCFAPIWNWKYAQWKHTNRLPCITKKTAMEMQFCIYRSYYTFIRTNWLPRVWCSGWLFFCQKIACHSEVVDPHLCEIAIDYHLAENPHTRLLPRIRGLAFSFPSPYHTYITSSSKLHGMT